MTFITVQCPHCHSEQIVKRGKTRRGTQRYLCQFPWPRKPERWHCGGEYTMCTRGIHTVHFLHVHRVSLLLRDG